METSFLNANETSLKSDIVLCVLATSFEMTLRFLQEIALI